MKKITPSGRGNLFREPRGFTVPGGHNACLRRSSTSAGAHQGTPGGPSGGKRPSAAVTAPGLWGSERAADTEVFL